VTTNTQRLLLQGMVTHAYDLGRGPTVICLHGNAGFADDFLPAAETLAARYHVWLVDRPGHGASACPSTPLSWEDHLAWLRALVHTVATGDTLLVAHSWSGALALAYGLQYPTDLTGLVLLAPLAMPLAPTATDRFLAAHFGAWLSGQPPLRWAVRRQIMRSLARAFAPAPVPPAYASRALASWSRAGSLRATAQDNLAARAALPRLVAQYSMLAVPAALVAGDRDRLLPPSEHAERLVSLAPQITLRLLPGVGHEIPHTHPEAVRKAVDDILAQCHCLTANKEDRREP